MIAAIRRGGARFSVTVPMNSKVTRGDRRDRRGRVDRGQVPAAIFDDQLGCWVSDAEVAETGYTAFETKRARRSPPG